MRGEGKTALSIMAAMAGTGFASGREIALFFSQLGAASWLAVGFASSLTGALIGAAIWRARQFGDSDRGAAARVSAALKLLLAAMASALVLAHAMELGALTLPVKHAGPLGAGLALGAALLILRDPGRSLPRLGMAVTAFALVLYVGMAVDPRPPRLNMRGQAVLRLAGSWRAATVLSILYASMNACAGAWAVRATRPVRARPLQTGLRVLAMLFGVLASANLALARGGPALIAQAEPTVLLAARWGIAGFWLCAAFGALCAVATLSASMSVFAEALGGRNRGMAAFFIALAAILSVVFAGTPR